MRPGEPTRSTLQEWLRTCETCGAVAPDLASLPAAACAIVRSTAYREIGAGLTSAAPFLRWSMLCSDEERREALLQAAWSADDAMDGLLACKLRLQAADAWGAHADLESALRLIDVLRRAGAVDHAIGLANDLAAGHVDESSAAILAFQRARIADGDTGRHLLSSALRPPARMPHVAHGKAKPAGFWSRLLGG